MNGHSTITSIARIAPFTYKDGETYIGILRGLEAYLTDLTSKFNEANDANAAALQSAIDKALLDIGELLELYTGDLDSKISEAANDLSNTIAGANTALDNKIADTSATLDSKIVAFTADVNAAIQSVLNASIETNDDIVSMLVADDTTDTSIELGKTFVKSSDVQSIVLTLPSISGDMALERASAPHTSFRLGNDGTTQHFNDSWTFDSAGAHHAQAVGGIPKMSLLTIDDAKPGTTVEVLARASYDLLKAGRALMLVVMPAGVDQITDGLYMMTQTQVEDGTVAGGLRMNTIVGGVMGGLAFQTGVTGVGWPDGNLKNTEYYMRLRYTPGGLMCRQWLTSAPENENWDLYIPADMLPVQLQNVSGVGGYLATLDHTETVKYLAVSTDGTTCELG